MATAPDPPAPTTGRSPWYIGLLLAVLLAGLNYHVSAEWHQDRWGFDQLDTTARRATFYLDGAFYYAFYEDVALAPDTATALQLLVAHDRVEAPSSVHALRRFSISTEAVLGFAWRAFGSKFATDLPSFYVDAVLLFQAAGVLLLFAMALALTGSLPAATMACLYFICHREEVTRVVAMPSLRENVSVVWLLAHLAVLLHVIAASRRQRRWQLVLVLTTALHVLTWQFAPFVMAVEVVALLALAAMGSLTLARLRHLLHAHAGAVLLAWVLHAGSAHLPTSSWALAVAASLLVLGWRRRLEGPAGWRCWALRLGGVALLTVAGRFALSQLGFHGTSHVLGFVSHRLFGGGDFHTMLYLCHPAFGSIRAEQLTFFLTSGLLPMAALALLAMWALRRRGRPVSAGVLLLALLAVGFVALAALANRFVVLAGTLICVLGALPFAHITRAELLATLAPRSPWRRPALWGMRATGIAALVALAWVGVPRVQTYLDVPHPLQQDSDSRQAADWIARFTPADAVVAADMGWSAAVRLLSRRRTVIHPHYEHASLRARVHDLYQMYGATPAAEIHGTLTRLGADYLLVDALGCYQPLPRSTCRMVDLVALGRPPAPPGTPIFCATLPPQSPGFREVFRNPAVRLFQVLPAPSASLARRPVVAMTTAHEVPCSIP